MSRPEEERELALLLHELLRSYQFQDLERVCDSGITVSECHALELVALREPVSVNDVAARLRVNKSTASRVLQSLAAKRLVKRQVDREDARAWKVGVTASGRRLWESIVEETAQCYGAAIADLPAADRKLAISVLRRLVSTATRRCQNVTQDTFEEAAGSAELCRAR